MFSELDKKLSQKIAKEGLPLDALGRLLVNDDEMLALVSGGASVNVPADNQALWNGACSNQYCFL